MDPYFSVSFYQCVGTHVEVEPYILKHV